MVTLRVPALGGLLALASCQEQEPTPLDPAAQAVRALTRASLDLRGVRPSDDELDAVVADQSALDGLFDTFVQDERFPERVVDLYNEIYLTRSEALGINTTPLEIFWKHEFFQLVGQEPLRLVAEVAAQDLPYTEIVTADWTMVNEELAAYYPVDYPEGATGWRQVSYTDGRPAAGVLATNGLWWRYTTTRPNANRSRANATARLVLCEDFLHRDVDIDPTVLLGEADAAEDATQSNEACANCHVSLDPLASHFFGFYLSNYTSVQEATTYHTGREPTWSTLTGVEPGYFGTPTGGLADLGPLIAQDPRFITCAVEQAWTLMLRRPPTLEDQDRLNVVRERFIQGGLTLRALYRAVVAEADYQGQEPDGAGSVDTKVVSVELLSSQIEDLTGFAWTYDGQDMLRADEIGFHLVAGGVDGITQTLAPQEPTTGLVLTLEALAELASEHAVDNEATLAANQRRLFTEVDFTETAAEDPDAIARQLVVLHRRLFGARLETDSEEILDGLALWETLYGIEPDPKAAWRGVLTALLRHPDLVLY